MKFAYKFSNLLGTVYKQGNLSFTPDGNTLLSPVGNRITMFDLKSNKAETLPCESDLNFTTVAISPDGNLVIAANEEGEAVMVSMRTRTIIYRYHFHRRVNAISFSPDGKKFLVTKEKTILLFNTPGRTRQYNPFQLVRTFYGATDNTTCIDWTTDSRAFCVGGDDKCTRVYGAEKFKNLIIYSLASNNDVIVNAFFDKESLNVYSLSRSGDLNVYECDTDLDGLVLDVPDKDGDDDDEDEKAKRKREEKKQQALTVRETDQKTKDKAYYTRTHRHNYKAARGEGAPPSFVTAAAYHKKDRILVTGFEDGSFFLHDMEHAAFNLIHSLSMSGEGIAGSGISSVAWNKDGDWVALGCSGAGHLLVWEWQSEQNVLKQQGHYSSMECLDYSPDGQYIVSGGSDAKVKVWNTGNGFCFKTFTEHLAAVTGVRFTQNGKAIVSASLDGTVRAFDLIRYRNFRTLTSPRPVQFSCVAVDAGGEIVCAGGRDVFDIFVWNLSKGSLMEVLSGHEGPISCLAFATNHYVLASGAWDKKLKLWDVFESRGAKETIMLNSDAQALAYRPDGEELAVATLDAQISFWNVHQAQQVGSVEGRHDLGYTRKDGDKITAKKSAINKFFNTLTYSADGACILAAGRSKNVCIYSVADQLLLKKFEITCNRSLDGTQEFLDRRKMTEWGSLALVDEGQGDHGTAISLPGVKKGDMSSRHWKPEVRVGQVRFSPTGRQWAATTTEGLLIYSLDTELIWDPYDLEVEVTPEELHRCLRAGDHPTALVLAFRLNEEKLIRQAVEAVPEKDVPVMCEQLAPVYVDKMLAFVARRIEDSRHLGFYLLWSKWLVFRHGPALKQRADTLRPTTRALIQAFTHRTEPLDKICEYNYHMIDYIINVPQGTKRKTLAKEEEDDSEEDMDTDTHKAAKTEAEDEGEERVLQEKWESSDDELDINKLLA